MTFTIDTNVLVYAVAQDEPDKAEAARDILLRAAQADAVLTAQAIAEFLNVVRRKSPPLFGAARAQAASWAGVFDVAATTWEVVAEAAAFAERHRLQLWDCVIWQAARAAGATMLLTEDLQDGLTIEGMTVLNPFVPANRGRVETLLQPWLP